MKPRNLAVVIGVASILVAVLASKAEGQVDPCDAYDNSIGWCQEGTEDYDCPNDTNSDGPKFSAYNVVVLSPDQLPDGLIYDPFGLDRNQDGIGCERDKMPLALKEYRYRSDPPNSQPYPQPELPITASMKPQLWAMLIIGMGLLTTGLVGILRHRWLRRAHRRW